MKLDLSLMERAGFFREWVLSDRGLEDELRAGRIKSNPELTESQVQPASLDMRIGKVSVFDADVRRAAAGDKGYLSLEEDLEPFAKKYFGEKDEGFILMPNAHAEITLFENLEFDPTQYDVSFELRSSRGRLGLTPYSRNLEIKEGKYMIPIFNNNPNPIKLYCQTPFAQLFFHPKKGGSNQKYRNGYLVRDPDEANELAFKHLEKPYSMLGAYVLFELGKKAFVFKRGLELIDTKKKYSDEELYHVIDTSSPFILSPGNAVIAQLSPKVSLPANVGLRLLHQVPYIESARDQGIGLMLDNHQANAGWVDPGYDGNITAHPLRRAIPMVISQGKPLAIGVFYKYTEPVLRPYGSEGLGSHYQKSQGTGFKS